MRRFLPLAALLVGSFAAPVCAQVSLDESLTQATLVHDQTAISLALRNTLSKTMDAVLRLDWLEPSDRVIGSAGQSSDTAPGISRIVVSLPLPATKADIRLLRLRYSVVPGMRNLGAFASFAGILSLVHIAPYAFSLEILGTPEARAGGAWELHVLAGHPATHEPVAGVRVEAGGAVATTSKEGLAVLQLRLPDDYDGNEIPLRASLGDFTQQGEISGRSVTRGEIRIQIDKPLYQPGQTLHIRTLAHGSDGRARPGEKQKIHVLDADGNLAHTVDVTSSPYGIASADWTIPVNAKSGKYGIEVSSDDFDNPFEREVEIRAYELPSFHVSARARRPYYLPGEAATIDLGAAHLFGKPVSHARARIDLGESDKAVWTGELDAAGHAQSPLPLEAVDIPVRENFVDRHYVAFVTDPSTNRTEQRKFDLRLTRAGLHLYLAYREAALAGERLYLSVFLPDGTPARAVVSASTGARCLTNRFGVCRIDVPASADSLRLYATSSGVRSENLDVRPGPPAALLLETDHALYRRGDPVRCHLAAHDQNARVLLLAWNARQQMVFSRMATLSGGVADVVIPYDARFGGQLSIAAAAAGTGVFASAAVLFPGGTAFQVAINSSKETYRPGEMARIDFQASSQAALGIAIVDQGVFERAETDSDLAGVGSMSREDLTHLDPSKIDEDYQLLARTLLAAPPPLLEEDNWLSETISAFEAGARKTLAPIARQLDDTYRMSRDYPRDEKEFNLMAFEVHPLRDPWGRPFYPTFHLDGSQNVLCVNSAGPDKQRGTDDDMCALEIKRPWFGLYEPLVRKALAAARDFPATKEEFDRQLRSAGLLFSALRDPWLGPLAVEISHFGPSRQIEITSAGPDRKWNTADDVSVADFQGTYFAQTDQTIRQLLNASKPFPMSSEQALAVLAADGFHFDALRDPWGHALSFRFHIEQQFADRISRYTYAEYQHPAELRQELTPIKIRLAMLDVRSDGPDGIPGTYDDFTLATFARWLKDEATRVPAASAAPRIELPGQAILTGVVRDQSGAAIPGASVYLDKIHETQTDAHGVYAFSGVPPGLYELRVQSPGFQVFVLARVPAAPDEVTKADVVLQVGAMSESVEVTASPVTVTTTSAEILASRASATTPRLREYFPETLYWQPELITDAQGKASVNVKLADSITTWKILLVASTLEGDIEESRANVRAFQPFVVDLDVPHTLTEGDRITLPVPIRNYSDRAQQVHVETGGATLLEQPGAIAPAAFANVLLDLRAAASPAKVKVTAVGNHASDAIEKPITIHPDGERFERAAANLMTGSGELAVALPGEIIPGSLRGELRIHPGILASIVDAMSVLLERPSGCGEQLISSSYPNLLLLRALKQAGIENHPFQAKAQRNLQLGYERLLGYQAASGGFTYWGKDDVDVALTAYAVEFLHDASGFIQVDDARVEKARSWLAVQKPAELQLRSWQLRGLLSKTGTAFDVNKQLAALAHAADGLHDPYAIAQFALAAMDAGQPELARAGIRLLIASAQPASGAVFWNLTANTPFHGWGHAGQMETTAVVVRALARWRKHEPRDAAASDVLDRGALYLLRNTSTGGAWSTSQATVQALLALLETWRQTTTGQPVRFEIRVAGVAAGDGSMAVADFAEPLTLDIARFLKAGERNQITVTSSAAGQLFQAQVDTAWYQPWQGDRPARDIRLETRFDHTNAAVNDAITCRVQLSRPSFRGYGMLIARIGLPPGSDVDRGTLAAAVADGKTGVDSFEVAPDSVTFYIWPRAADNAFSFVFRPRFSMTAKSASSLVYDYYNPDERAILAPQVFTVR